MQEPLEQDADVLRRNGPCSGEKKHISAIATTAWYMDKCMCPAAVLLVPCGGLLNMCLPSAVNGRATSVRYIRRRLSGEHNSDSCQRNRAEMTDSYLQH
jgi:hypothetical protein